MSAPVTGLAATQVRVPRRHRAATASPTETRLAPLVPHDPGGRPNPRSEDPRFRLGFVRLVTHHFSHAGCPRENELLTGGVRLAGVPTILRPRAPRLIRHEASTSPRVFWSCRLPQIGMERASEADVIRTGAWPTPVLHLGHTIRLPTAPLLDLVRLAS